MVVKNGPFFCGHLSQLGVFFEKAAPVQPFFNPLGVVLLPKFLVICQKQGSFWAAPIKCDLSLPTTPPVRLNDQGRQ